MIYSNVILFHNKTIEEEEDTLREEIEEEGEGEEGDEGAEPSDVSVRYATVHCNLWALLR